MKATYPVEITQLEGLFLSDALSMFSQGPPDAMSEQASPYPDLLLKIGSAVLELDRNKTPVTVCFDLNELWMMREVSKSSVVVGGERVGINLLVKVYSAIRSLSAGSDVDSAVDNFGEVSVEEPGKEVYASQLSQIRDNADRSEGGQTYGNKYQPDDTNKDNPGHDTGTAA